MNKKVSMLLCTFGIATVALMGAGCSAGTTIKQTFCKHEYGAYTVTKEAKCYEEGAQERTCGKCGKVDVEKIVKTSHTPGETKGYVAPTCTEDGKHASTYCAVEECGAILQEGEKIPALGHEEKVIEGVEPGCLTDGKTDGVGCTRCDEILTAQEVIPNLGGHKWESIEEDIAPTCQNEGYQGGAQCTTCGELTGGTVVPVTDHEFKNGECKHCGASEELATVAENIASYYFWPYYSDITETMYDYQYGESFLGYTFRYRGDDEHTVNNGGFATKEEYYEWCIANEYNTNSVNKFLIKTFNTDRSYRYTTVEMYNGKLMLNGKILNSNISYYLDKKDNGFTKYVSIPKVLEVEGFENIVDIRYVYPKDIVYKDHTFYGRSRIEVLHKPLNVVAYVGNTPNALEKQDNGLYKYTFGSQGDFVMNSAVEIGIGETLVCDFSWKQGHIGQGDTGWFGVVFGNGNSLENYPHTEYGMRCYSEDRTTYMLNEQVVSTDETLSIDDIDNEYCYRIMLTKEATGLYSYRLYNWKYDSKLGLATFQVVDEYLNFECPTPSSLMLCVHQDEGNTNSSQFIFEDVVFYKV